MNTGTKILAIVIAVLVLAGGLALSSFSSPYREPVVADPPQPAIAPPDATPYVKPAPASAPEPVNVPLPTPEPEPEPTESAEPEPVAEIVCTLQ